MRGMPLLSHDIVRQCKFKWEHYQCKVKILRVVERGWREMTYHTGLISTISASKSELFASVIDRMYSQLKSLRSSGIFGFEGRAIVLRFYVVFIVWLEDEESEGKREDLGDLIDFLPGLTTTETSVVLELSTESGASLEASHFNNGRAFPSVYIPSC
jgi:hypothetical protein